MQVRLFEKILSVMKGHGPRQVSYYLRALSNCADAGTAWIGNLVQPEK
jgi:hypothetical protein